MDYIMNHAPSAECVFCKAMREEDGPKNLVVHRGPEVFVILNRFPYTSGHVMVVPRIHTASFDALSPQVRAVMMELANTAIRVLRALYQPQGFNLGINMGEAAGAGIAEHLHLHVVPRWSGDTNFMSAVAATRVLPERLEDSYQRILSQWGQTTAGDEHEIAPGRD
jgi:ATP adenylyltransferase